MKLISNNNGVLELRWTWLPYWISANAALKAQIERDVRDRMILNAVTTEEIDLLHDYVLASLKERCSEVEGAEAVLDAIARAG